MKIVQWLKKNISILAPGALLYPVAPPANFSPPVAPGLTSTTLRDLILFIKDWLLGIGLVIALIMIVWGGLAYMFAGGSEEKVKKAQERLKSGIIGALIIAGVWLILYTVLNVVVNVPGGTI